MVSLQTSDNLLVCTACGAQYDIELQAEHQASSSSSSLSPGEFIPAGQTLLHSCRICDDPRQYVPASGQSFTTLGRMKAAKRTAHGGYQNVFRRRGDDSKIIEMWTEPKFGIGQRACIIQTPHGNVMWDLVAYLDQDTVDKIQELGGLKFIIISHPHFYTTWADWATTFNCPIYMARIDAEAWANRTSNELITNDNSDDNKTKNDDARITDVSTLQPDLRLLEEQNTELLPGVTAIVTGGHFPGSLVLHTATPNTNIPTIFAADAFAPAVSAANPDIKYHRPNTGITSYTFMWSYPNMIPLNPDSILDIWKACRDVKFEFRRSYGVMPGSVVVALDEEDGLRGRLLESMKIFVKSAGWIDHPLLREELSVSV